MTCNTALKTLVTLFVLCTELAAQTTGDADRMFYFANGKVKDAVVHDVCDVRWPEMRDQLDAADRVIYGLIVAALQLDHNGERDTTTEVFCVWGRRLTKPPQ